MECGIIGLPGVGKTTLFNALTRQAVAGFSDKPNVGVAAIPDPRLDQIAVLVPTQKIINATIQLVDIRGVPSGSPSKLNGFLSHVRQVDALCHVVRCADFGGLGPAKPVVDIENLDTELILADLVVAESARDKAVRTARTGDPEAKARLAVLEKTVEILEATRPIRDEDSWNEAEQAILKSYGMITAKPVLYVANVGEDDLDGSSDAALAVKSHAASAGGEAVALCASLEAELGELDDDDRAEMLGSMGLTESAIGPLARGMNDLLGLAHFYTAGDKEVRAWTITAGASAPRAAGSVHSDIERGFIRAECFHINDLVEFKSEKAIRDAGRLRSEGKTYQIQDGDIVHFLFNV